MAIRTDYEALEASNWPSKYSDTNPFYSEDGHPIRSFGILAKRCLKTTANAYRKQFDRNRVFRSIVIIESKYLGKGVVVDHSGG